MPSDLCEIDHVLTQVTFESKSYRHHAMHTGKFTLEATVESGFPLCIHAFLKVEQSMTLLERNLVHTQPICYVARYQFIGSLCSNTYLCSKINYFFIWD